jgi:quercetin dioxygenase-like cupin family protein
MAHRTARPAEVDSVLPGDEGGTWFLADALDTAELGVTVLELAPGAAGKSHSHDDHEEVCYVPEAGVAVHLEDETVPLVACEAIRVDQETERQLVDGDERSRLVLVGAPRDATLPGAPSVTFM